MILEGLKTFEVEESVKINLKIWIEIDRKIEKNKKAKYKIQS